MDLGIFSLSLTVSDIKVSRAFYEKLGFAAKYGDESQNWLIMINGDTKIGLFQGMFDKNTLTFNPVDVRGIQKQLKAQGVPIASEADESTEGPAHMTLFDPDGNPILFDQHDADFMAQIAKENDNDAVGWIDLTVPDAVSIRDFYQAVIGWVPEPVPQGEYDDYNMTQNGTPVTGICHKRGQNAHLPSQWMVYFRVADVRAAVEAATARGGKVISGPMVSESGGYAVIEDPAGAVCALMS